jgi:Eukaryotic aspartyl protease
MFYQTLLNDNLITAPIFSFFIGRNDIDAQITFGSVDIARFQGDVLWAPVVQDSMGTQQHWAVSISSALIGDAVIIFNSRRSRRLALH